MCALCNHRVILQTDHCASLEAAWTGLTSPLLGRKPWSLAPHHRVLNISCNLKRRRNPHVARSEFFPFIQPSTNKPSLRMVFSALAILFRISHLVLFSIRKGETEIWDKIACALKTIFKQRTALFMSNFHILSLYILHGIIFTFESSWEQVHLSQRSSRSPQPTHVHASVGARDVMENKALAMLFYCDSIGLHSAKEVESRKVPQGDRLSRILEVAR